MSNPTITNYDTGNVVFEAAGADFRDELLTTAAADEIAEGTILARKKVADAITAEADAGNTGDGTCTAAAVLAGSNILFDDRPDEVKTRAGFGAVDFFFRRFVSVAAARGVVRGGHDLFPFFVSEQGRKPRQSGFPPNVPTFSNRRHASV